MWQGQGTDFETAYIDTLSYLPTFADCRRADALDCCCAPPTNQKHKNHRMLYLYSELDAALKGWGIANVRLESAAEARRIAKQYNTDL